MAYLLLSPHRGAQLASGALNVRPPDRGELSMPGRCRRSPPSVLHNSLRLQAASSGKGRLRANRGPVWNARCSWHSHSTVPAALRLCGWLAYRVSMTLAPLSPRGVRQSAERRPDLEGNLGCAKVAKPPDAPDVGVGEFDDRSKRGTGAQMSTRTTNRSCFQPFEALMTCVPRLRCGGAR